MTRAYSKLYLESAQDILGQAFDWVVNTCGESLSVFWEAFCRSSIARLFGRGYPKYTAGCNGAELVNFVREDLALPEYTQPHEFYADRSPEYWTGWVMAYVQWKSRLRFDELFRSVPIEKVLALYPLGHEQDIRSVADTVLEWAAEKRDA